MNNQKRSLLFGGILILIGLFVLLSNLDVIFIESEMVVALFFLAGGAYFFYLFLEKKAVGHLIVSSILTFIGLTVFLQTIPGFNDEFIAVLLFGGLAALFLFGFLRNTDNWGFLIPSGIFSTLAIIVLVDTLRFFDDEVVGSIFFLGLGLTFGALYLIRNEKNKLEWAKVPAVGLLAFSAFIYLVNNDSFLVDMFFPLALILIGGYLVFHASKNRTRLKAGEST